MKSAFEVIIICVFLISTTVFMVECAQPLECNMLQIPTKCHCSSPKGLTGAIISCKGITELPITINSGGNSGYIYQLYLADNNIQTLPSNAFQGLSIQRIDLNNNPLNNISDLAFAGQQITLTELKISGNKTADVLPPWNSVKILTSLQILHMRHFKVASNNNLEGLGLISFPSLVELQLEEMKIFHIDSDVFALPKLKILRLINNLFESLPADAIHNTLVNLEHLTLTGSKISDIPFYYFQRNTKVKFFDVSRNNISLLEDECFFGVTDVLETLILNQNPLSNVVHLNQIQYLSALIDLRLEHVGLRVIPPSPVFMKNKLKLKNLSLNGNQLRNLSGAIFSSTGYNIRKIDLSDNQLDSLSSDFFTNLTSLTDLSLQGQTSGVTFNLPSFSSLTSLQNLNLEQTKLDTVVTWNEIKHLQNLVSLNLDSTGLTFIQEFVFRNMKNLYQLSLHDNNISSVTQEMFVGPKDSLEYLYLSNNKITIMDECVFHNFSGLLHISLTANPLHCDCKLKWLKTSISESKIALVTQQEKCNSPAKNANKLFTGIPVEDFLCDFHQNEIVCPNYYLPSTTIATPTVAPTTGSTIPTVEIFFSFSNKAFNSISITFKAVPKQLVLEFIIEHTNMKTLERGTRKLPNSATTYTILDLDADTNYEVCVRVKKSSNSFDSECLAATTMVNPHATTKQPLAVEQKSETGIIIGASIAGVVLLILLVAILYLVIFKRRVNSKNLESSPVKAVSRGNLPTIGYDSKRFRRQKKQNGRPNSVNNDNEVNESIQVAVISTGQSEKPNLGRISAGSYQFLDENHKSKENQNPSAVYENNVDTRPLPSTPRKNHSYQNEGFQTSPDTEPHAYTEIGLV